jgi:GMP synthase-like glutamine amidotransferase
MEEIPMFGVCLGLQLMVKAFGGEVYSNPIEEIGFKHENNKWYQIELTKEGIEDPVFKGIENNFTVFQLHSETVRLIKGIKVLGTGEFCKNQVIKIGDYNYGFQFHFELTEDLYKLLLNKAPELREHNLSSMLSDFSFIKNQYLERGKKIFQNYLHLINLI